MSTARWIATGVCLLTTLYAWVRIAPFAQILGDDLPGPRVRRLVVRRGFAAIGLWQWSIAGFLIVSGTGPFPIALIGVGAFMMLASRYPGLYGL